MCCPEIGTNPKTLGVLPTTTIKQLAEQCATRFEQGKLDTFACPVSTGVLCFNYTEQKYKLNTFVFAPIFHELNSKI